MNIVATFYGRQTKKTLLWNYMLQQFWPSLVLDTEFSNISSRAETQKSKGSMV